MMTLLGAMARQEGFFVAGSRPAKNNNPGDIEAGKFTRAHGAIGSDGRFAIFRTTTDGYTCMAKLLDSAYHGMTIGDALAKYAPPVENQTSVYLAHILNWTGLKATDIISDHLELPGSGS
jgi:hypothetical protein